MNGTACHKWLVLVTAATAGNFSGVVSRVSSLMVSVCVFLRRMPSDVAAISCRPQSDDLLHEEQLMTHLCCCGFIARTASKLVYIQVGVEACHSSQRAADASDP